MTPAHLRDYGLGTPHGGTAYLPTRGRTDDGLGLSRTNQFEQPEIVKQPEPETARKTARWGIPNSIATMRGMRIDAIVAIALSAL